jgi:uncharacterized protein (DUF433 family)
MIQWRDYLVSDPAICGGQLCAKGTRVMVTNILDNLAERAPVTKSSEAIRLS